jgi:hypothetical protein
VLLEHGVDGADGDAGGAGDGADGFAVGVAGEDDAAFVGVDDAGPATDAAAGSGAIEAVAGFANDVAAAVLGQGERQVEDEVTFGVLAGGDAFQGVGPEYARNLPRRRWLPGRSAVSARLRLVHGFQPAPLTERLSRLVRWPIGGLGVMPVGMGTVHQLAGRRPGESGRCGGGNRLRRKRAAAARCASQASVSARAR